jgi:bacillithiol system protein YtxJ
MIHDLSKKELPDTCYVFKHSTRCPVSTRAAEVVKSSESKLQYPLYWINVIEQRDVSNWVSETYSAQHQSPQLLLIIDGKVDGNWTHQAIKMELFP